MGSLEVSTSKSSSNGKETTTGPANYYALFDLDKDAAIRQLQMIIDSVNAHLGDDLEISVEIRASKTDGYDDTTRRTVSENASSLGAKGNEFN